MARSPTRSRSRHRRESRVFSPEPTFLDSPPRDEGHRGRRRPSEGEPEREEHDHQHQHHGHGGSLHHSPAPSSGGFNVHEDEPNSDEERERILGEMYAGFGGAGRGNHLARRALQGRNEPNADNRSSGGSRSFGGFSVHGSDDRRSTEENTRQIPPRRRRPEDEE
ncbi:hypothetical protein JCM6882_002232 [Rhodosporidiobolus microsporus]